MPPSVTVQPATEGDAAAIRRVAHAAWHATYRDVFDEARIDEMVEEGYARDVLTELIALDEVGLFVATVEEAVVGYASCGMTEAIGVGDLDIYVHPEYWGAGVGTALLERGRQHLADIETTTIRDEVLVANEVGNAFYEKHFERVGQRTVEFDGIERTVNVYEARV
ncbi:GNAT family N-acetyltransferase [Halomicrobium katesii]|uniref:GNAT family N-acetyltransferase n=1 Tax=Halomicrobium katesii TaxID=437163 RepID=UPI000365726A|nr:GNAT family N-acetyltransferase [Halomicrobium katesii]